MACTERSRWRWRSLPEAQPAVGIVWMVDGLHCWRWRSLPEAQPAVGIVWIVD